MTIKALKKLTFCGLSKAKPAALAALQQLGKAHLITAGRQVGEIPHSPPKLAERAYKALKYLNQCPNRRHQQHDPAHFDFNRIVDRTLEIQFESRQLTDKREALSKRINEVEPWGNFKLPEHHHLGGLKLWFYIVPKRLMRKVSASGLVWQVVYQDNLNDYVVVIARDEPPITSMPVARTHTGTRSLSELKTELEEIELTLEDLQAERESLTRWIGLIAANLGKALDRSELNYAKGMTLDTDGVFISQVWADTADLPAFENYAAAHHLAMVSSDPEPSDVPPTLLKNTGFWSGGQDLTGFYQTPAYQSWDPSPVVFFSFALFFAMIMCDAGYALLFGLLLAAKWRSMGKSATGARIRMMILAVLVASLVWGVLANSYFGYSFPEASVFAELAIIKMEDFNAMMQLSVTIGVLHLALANAITAYRHRLSVKALASVGWLLIIVGGYSFWLTQPAPPALARDFSVAMMGFGGLLLLLFSSDRPVERPIDWLWRTAEGLKSLVEITTLFGNILSYLRLFALGMASVSLALTFNQLALQVHHAMPGIGLVFSFLILLIGHTLNLLLCLLGGVVHGLRLNFIEFYNWSVSDEGYPFKAFATRGVSQ